VDLEKHIPIDLLPDRQADTLEHWLQAHPGGEIISRDRGGNYAEGARKGAAQARQVADRFHLLKNLGESLEDFFRDKKAALKEAMQDQAAPLIEEAPPVAPWHTGMRHPARSQKPRAASRAGGALS
jgi:transposase